jgi:hypothetical protein
MTMDATVPAVLVILVAVFTSITAPLILSSRAQKMRRTDRQAEWDRQDEKDRIRKADADKVATVAAKAASDLVASQKRIADQAAEAARLLVVNNELVAASTRSLDIKLDQNLAQSKRIHTLVNSDMTAARQSELDQTRAIVVVLERVISMDRSRGTVPDHKDVEALEAATQRISELEAILADRLAQMREVEADTAQARREGGVVPDDSPGALDASAANLNASAANLDDAAAHLTAAATAHEGAQERLDDKTAALEDKAEAG